MDSIMGRDIVIKSFGTGMTPILFSGAEICFCVSDM